MVIMFNKVKVIGSFRKERINLNLPPSAQSHIRKSLELRPVSNKLIYPIVKVWNILPRAGLYEHEFEVRDKYGIPREVNVYSLFMDARLPLYGISIWEPQQQKKSPFLSLNDMETLDKITAILTNSLLSKI